jgi:hypothetical protein
MLVLDFNLLNSGIRGLERPIGGVHEEQVIVLFAR